MQQLKHFYRKYLEIDLSANREEAFVIPELNVRTHPLRRPSASRR